VSEAEQILGAARTVVVVDWPSRDVPDTLARAGYTVLVKGGPGPAASLARQLGATAIWHQSGLASIGAKDPHGCWMEPGASQTARAIVEAAGLAYVESPYIADEVRRLGIGR
jgi:hypothetical protein